jgi:hypothetical protein
MLDRVYAAQELEVEVPTGLDKIKDMSREERRALYRKLVAEGRR